MAGEKGGVEFDLKNLNISVVFCLCSVSVLTLHVYCLMNRTLIRFERIAKTDLFSWKLTLQEVCCFLL